MLILVGSFPGAPIGPGAKSGNAEWGGAKNFRVCESHKQIWAPKTGPIFGAGQKNYQCHGIGGGGTGHMDALVHFVYLCSY